MTNVVNRETALSRLLDEASIRDTIARFANVATHADFNAFGALWADDATWTIGGRDGQPFERRAEGTEDITALFRNLREERDYFVQFVLPGAIQIDGDTATVQSICHEAAQGGGRYYRTNGVWSDTLRRSEDGWVFTNRSYRYLWLDFSPISGEVSWADVNAH